MESLNTIVFILDLWFSILVEGVHLGGILDESPSEEEINKGRKQVVLFE